MAKKIVNKPITARIDWLHDRRTDCYSGLAVLTAGTYLGLVKDAHDARGGISGQRDVLTTTTGKRIRERMIADIRAGAVLPPVVIGVVVSKDELDELKENPQNTEAFLKSIEGEELSIIDGMQRTAAMIEAGSIDSSVFKNDVRVEFWVSQTVKALIYRMLVLNTAQVPWTLARQLSVVYSQLVEEIEKNVKNLDKVFTPDKPGRRRSGGQFSSDSLVELYLAFSMRKTNIDPRESLSEEFSRLDLVDNLSEDKFQGHFYKALSALVVLDLAFEKYDGSPSTNRFKKGKDIFGSQPARIGFIAAVAQHVVGRQGLERKASERDERMKTITKNAEKLAARLGKLNNDELGEFLMLDILTEVLDKKVGQVGRYERSVFSEAFKVLIDEQFDVPSLKPCWLAG
jgi:hypothetical protein